MAAVLDASALLAYVFDEPGADVVDRALAPGDAFLSSVNLVEVLSTLAGRGESPEFARRRFARRGLLGRRLEIYPFDEERAHAAAALRASTRVAGLSLGDRACLALAATLGVPALTTDRSWAMLDLPVQVSLIR